MFSGAADTTVDQLCRPHTLSRTLGVQLEILALTQVAIKFTTEGAGRCAWLATSTNLFLGQPSTIVWRYLTYQEQGMITLGGGAIGLKEYQFCDLSQLPHQFLELGTEDIWFVIGLGSRASSKYSMVSIHTRCLVSQMQGQARGGLNNQYPLIFPSDEDIS